MNSLELSSRGSSNYNVVHTIYIFVEKSEIIVELKLIENNFYKYQSSRKRRIRRMFTPNFAFVCVKFPSEDSYLRSIATGRPN